MKKLLLILLSLPLLTTAQLVRVPFSCAEGNAFTIRIPVKFRENTTVQYAWYRNDTLIEGSHKLLLGEKTIAYTIPADKAFGTSVAFHFKYCLHDECSDVWTKSPTYLVNFHVFLPPQVAAIMGDTVACAGTPTAYSTTYISGVYYMWSVPVGWTITAGANTHSITVKAGTAGGFIVVVPANSSGVGATRTLAVSTVKLNAPGAIGFEAFSHCSSVNSAGVIGFAADTCAGGVSNAGVIDFAAFPCSGGVSTAGTIDFGRY